jgi:hypothetical protein
VLLDVLENARVPDRWKNLVPEPEQGEIKDVNPDAEGSAQAGFDTDKFMGQAKAVLMKCVVEACAETDLSDREAHAKVWERFGNWMGKGSSSEGDCEGRGDLVGCALLAMGNQVRSGKSGWKRDSQPARLAQVALRYLHRRICSSVRWRRCPIRDLQAVTRERGHYRPPGPIRHRRPASQPRPAGYAQVRPRAAGCPSFREVEGIRRRGWDPDHGPVGWRGHGRPEAALQRKS